ncbi:hypothetical protein [Actinocatenispora rupis]|uniref:Uncharacterized protein n=1 Tax=Actinocatenispora rupis TaxID=519421 RepID=A0A8J3NCH1_9ACTN|nr:hypothetical protein [Actinocatenispora rupis]GID11767.1 hypothetical protein Aru02nite_26560 [Actinocatenispora rupis]
MSDRPHQDDQRTVPSGPTAPTGSGARALDVVLRIVGGVVAVWGGVLTALLEAFLVPLRIGGVRIPFSLLLAVVCNILLMLFARAATGNRFVALLPGIAWFVVTIVLSGQTAAGDTVLVGNDWMPIALLLVGAASVTVGAFLVVVRRPR